MSVPGFHVRAVFVARVTHSRLHAVVIVFTHSLLLVVSPCELCGRPHALMYVCVSGVAVATLTVVPLEDVVVVDAHSKRRPVLLTSSRPDVHSRSAFVVIINVVTVGSAVLACPAVPNGVVSVVVGVLVDVMVGCRGNFMSSSVATASASPSSSSCAVLCCAVLRRSANVSSYVSRRRRRRGNSSAVVSCSHTAAVIAQKRCGRNHPGDPSVDPPPPLYLRAQKTSSSPVVPPKASTPVGGPLPIVGPRLIMFVRTHNAIAS